MPSLSLFAPFLIEPSLLSLVVDAVGVLGIPLIPSLTALAGYFRRKWKRQLLFSPATAFAFTYHDRYLKPLCRGLAARQAPFEVRVVMPARLNDLAAPADRLAALAPGAEEVVIETDRGVRTGRAHTPPGGPLQVLDIPRILATLTDIITDAAGPRRVHLRAWEALERQELGNFRRKLEALVADGPAAPYVTVGTVDEFRRAG